MEKDNLPNQTSANEESMLETVAIDRQKDYVCKDEIYCNWYECPSCKSDYVRSGDNFCSNCGCKFKWSGYYC
jgi:hypothetical protein